MLSRNLSRQSASTSTQPQSQPHTAPGRRKAVLLQAFQSSEADRAAAAAAVQCIAPSSNLDTYEQAIITFGQAFMTHELHRKVNTRLGREQQLFSGISRLMLDSFPDEPVLYVTKQGPAHAAAVVLSSTQEAQMAAMQKTVDFNVTPGTLQMLQAIPESSLPIVMAAGRQLREAGAAAMHAAGHSSYLKLMLIASRPEAQGSGLGSAVLHAVVAAADRQRMPVYLEAAHDGLVSLYERYAFKPLGKLDTMTMMVRECL